MPADSAALESREFDRASYRQRVESDLPPGQVPAEGRAYLEPGLGGTSASQPSPPPKLRHGERHRGQGAGQQEDQQGHEERRAAAIHGQALSHAR
ncbi:MAG TPA: hypothetical protein VG817_06180 [Gemmatimonadales bacterium]|nr:hypothetical protein [Gemmatimonadales bacterium]